jgi:hypothetical protein
MMVEFIIYVVLGCCAGFLSGLFGIGGGMIIVPALAAIFAQFQIVDSAQIMHMTVGTSLASSIITLIFTVNAYQKHGSVRWPVVAKLGPGIALGASVLGPSIILYLNTQHLKMAFSLFCLCIAAQIFFTKKGNEGLVENLPGKLWLFILGLFTGTLSSLLGIAGGAITGAILNFYHMNIRKVLGTSAAISIVIAIAGTIGLIFAGYHQTDLPKWSTGFIYWPAFLGIAIPSPFLTPLGTKLAHKLNTVVLKKLFAVLLIVIAIKMVF